MTSKLIKNKSRSNMGKYKDDLRLCHVKGGGSLPTIILKFYFLGVNMVKYAKKVVTHVVMVIFMA